MRCQWRSILIGAVWGLSWSCAYDGDVLDDDVDDDDVVAEVKVDPGIDEEFGADVDVAEIRGGRARNDHPEIGEMFQHINGPNAWFRCTATLVDRKIAITAGHCVEYKNQDRAGNYGYLEIKTPTSSGGLQIRHYTINGYHNFDGKPHNVLGDPDDVGLIRLSKAVPCSVAHPAHLSRDGPPTGTVVSRWGFGVCGSEADRKRVRHFRRGSKTAMLCPGDSGGPTLDPDGAVYQINSGHRIDGDMQDGVARVGKEWNGITRVMDEWGRAGRCD
jgi:hypothetical protein